MAYAIARSFLFVPGNRPDRFDKALASGADVVVLDLEDSVATTDKAGAREAVAAWLSPDRRAYVRVNAASTEWFDEDLVAVDRPGLSGIMLPKAEGPEQISAVERTSQGAGVIALVETALGIWEARALAESPRVSRLALGTVDLQLDAGIAGDGMELLYARSRLVLASRAANIHPPVDGVTVALDDAGLLAADVARARRLGFGGKLCVHPRQVAAVNDGFGPTAEEVAWAGRVLGAERQHGTGAVRVAGELVDLPVVQRARDILSKTNPEPPQ